MNVLSGPTPASSSTLLVWLAITAAVVGIFVGTLTLTPGRSR